MAERQSYPSPEAAGSREAGPFYGNAGNEPNGEGGAPTEDVSHLQLGEDKPQEHNHEQSQEQQQEQSQILALSQAINPDLQYTTSQDIPTIMAHDNAQQHIAQEVMNQVHDGLIPQYPGPMERHSQPTTPGAPMAISIAPSSVKARSKVSRACDECRRKKVRNVCCIDIKLTDIPNRLDVMPLMRLTQLHVQHARNPVNSVNLLANLRREDLLRGQLTELLI
jgi:hypothetical protein